ncbi:hypothetical protein ACQXZ6_09250 [Corynebacterium diphtheriae]|uniref:hypothetical protein n=1 Tax=Corynebacterium diphtheriae TaxID=1717 RepID=UPI000245BCB1|nr:hypothetical protein [Corynebacterium diphtheriae]AEX47190.1 hypothetical protein CDB402_1894 [Corynebacterium diphtheriae INCA 402]
MAGAGNQKCGRPLFLRKALAVVPMLMGVSVPVTMAKMPAMKSPTEELLSYGTTGA